MNSYHIGAVVRLKIAFTNQEGTAVDPGTVRAKVKTPLGVVTTYTYPTDGIQRTGTGVYYYDVEPAQQGVWKFRWEGTGSNKGANESAFEMLESEFD